MGLWALLGVIAWITKYFPGKYNNFSIFRQSFWHTLNELPLYAAYPEEYNDIFHYGPVFSLVVAPFAITPLWLGLLTWSVAQSLFLFWAVKMLPGIKRERIFIYWFCAHELLTSLFMSQFNISIAAIIVLAYALIEKEKDVWATFVIMLGTFTKLYGITGLAFFFFSRHKMKFSLSCVGWAVVMVVAPMILSGPDYIMSQYTGWFEDLSGKNSENLFALMQNISFLGMVRKISGSVSYSDIYLIIGGLIVFGLPYLRISQYKYEAFRKTLLASVLMFVVLFSPVRFHLFIVSDGSRRGYEPETIDRLRQLIPNVCVVDYKPNRGKGYALREAVKRCTSPYIIYTDYDFPYTNDSFGRMVETLLGGADVVVATRSKSYQENLPPFRKVLSKLSHICNTWILRIKIKDTQGGMKGFSQAGQAIFLTTRINSFLFDTEFIYKASRRKEINLRTINANIKEGLAVSDMGFKVLRREALNFLSILFHRD